MSNDIHEHERFVRIVKEINLQTGHPEFLEWICIHCGKIYFRIKIISDINIII